MKPGPALLFITLAVAAGLPGCRTLPPVHDKPVVTALSAPTAGPLAGTARSLAAGRPAGDSSLLLLTRAEEALDWRLALIDSARRSIDIQVFLWDADLSGTLIFERVLQAAERGVRVRILVDHFLRDSDEGLAALSRHHPNFEVRLFNPTHLRGTFGGLVSTAASFKELNRRMHNKTFTADRHMAIVGGRNIGDHYYGLDRDYNFVDLDVLAAGPVVAEVSDGFDRFWNSSVAYPCAMLDERAGPELIREGRAEFHDLLEKERDGRLARFSVERRDWRSELAGLKGRMVRGRARFIQDHPEPERDRRQVVDRVSDMTRRQDDKLRFISPYMVPSDEGIEKVAQRTRGGLEVELLVPSLAASDQPVVVGHYAKRRKQLLEAGARLHELRGDPSEEVRKLVDTAPVRGERVKIHLKAVVGDRRHCFIGSLNLDPRSLEINTESGMLIDSRPLAAQLAGHFDMLAGRENSWEVIRDSRGRLRWQSHDGTRSSAPPAKWSRRLGSWFGGLLPIKDQI